MHDRIPDPCRLLIVGINPGRLTEEVDAVGRDARGLQPETLAGVPVWVVGNPSGLNAHETVVTLAESYREVWEATARERR